MKIGVIGTGNIGGTVASKLSAAGHNVRVANSRGPESLKGFAGEIGATAVDTRGAVKDVDLIVISIPFPSVAELPKDLFAKSRRMSPSSTPATTIQVCTTHRSQRLMEGCRIATGCRSSSAAL